MTGRHECNTTYFSCISADLLRHGKTIIGEEDDKLVSMTARCEFHLSSKPFIHHESHLIEPPQGNESWYCSRLRLPLLFLFGPNPHVVITMCVHLKYVEYGVLYVNKQSQIYVHENKLHRGTGIQRKTKTEKEWRRKKEHLG